ncbi:MAG TPA: DUF3618 domain-containing protein [Luteitalea sp.]|nr:DUF3618 domain-containing protein [Luteitalea sp.]
MDQERDPLDTPRPRTLAPDLPASTVPRELDDAAEPGLGSAVAAPRASASGDVASAIRSGAGTARPGPAATSTALADADDPDQIREQIERTREDMSQTLNELQQRLSPQHLADQAKASVREATVGRMHDLVGSAGDTASQVAVRAQDAAETVVEQVREHPVPVALAGVGAGLVWWMMRRSSSRSTWSSEDMYDWDDPLVSYDRDMATLDIDSDDGTTRRASAWTNGGTGWTRVLRDHPVPASIAAASLGYMLWNRSGMAGDATLSRTRSAYGDDAYVMEQETGGTAQRVADSAREMGRQARERAAGISGQMGETMREAQHRASEVTHDVQRRLRSAGSRTTTQFDRWMRDNPMALGIAALAAGALVGLALPRTSAEDTYLGASRDALMDRATDSAQQLKEQVREKVQTVASDLAQEFKTGSTNTPATSQV